MEALRARNYAKPLLICYGFGLDYADCIEYHKTRQLPCPPSAKRPGSLLELTHDVADHLRGLCDFYELDIRPAYTLEFDLMLHLYDNYTIKSRELTEKDENEVVKILKDELVCLKDQQPKWFLPIVQP